VPFNAMSMRSKEEREELAKSPSIGGGNAWRVAAQTSTTPDAVAVVADKPLTDRLGKPQSEFSLRELDELAQAWSVYYLNNGVRPRDRVAIYLEDCFEDQLQLTALAQIGAIPVLLNGKLDPEVALQLIQRAEPVGIYTDDAHLTLLSGRHTRLPGLRWTRTRQDVGILDDQALSEQQQFRHHDADPVLLCHSSGTTGIPKLVVWTHRQSTAGARFRLATHPEPADSILLSAVPQSHSGAIAFTFYALLAGLPLVALSDPSGPAVARAAATYRPTTVLAFNQTLAELALMKPEPADFASVADWMNVGDSAHHAHLRELLPLGSHVSDGQRVPGSIFGDGLGSSELGWAALRRVVTPGDPVRPRHLGKRVAIADVAVLREDGTHADVGEIGLLGVSSDSIAGGYWNSSDTQYRSMLGGYWLSGDLVYRDAEDDYFHVDRVADRIDSPSGTGYSLLMEEILLLQLEEIADCAVIAGGDGQDTVPVAVIRTKQAGSDPQDLLDRANKALSNAGQPPLAMVEIVEQESGIPLGATGKTLKRNLRERYADLPAYLASRSDDERHIATQLLETR
jgi:acyl-coenzyme A synthetase/AMP-(fatty) acid ligase